MTRRSWVAVIAVVLVATGVGVWMQARRGGKTPAPASADHARIHAPPAPKRMASHTSVPHRPPPVSIDDDPVGTLRLEGQVIDMQQRPIGGATVTVSSHPPRTTKTQGDGSFAFDKLVGRRYSVTAKKGALVGGPVMSELTATSDPVIIRVRRGASVKVKVVDADTQRPVAGAQVEVRGTAKASATTAADGVAEVDGVAPGFSILVASAKGYAQHRRALEVPAAQKQPIEATIALRSGAAVSGQVVDPDGHPLAGAHVIASDASALYPLASPDHDGVVTDAHGRFRIAAVAAGTYRFLAHHPDYPPGSSSLITINGTDPTTGIRIQLSPGGRISGHVVTKSGRPVKWATVRVARRGRNYGWGRGGVRQATADATGAFSLQGLPREKLGLAASSGADTSDVVAVDLTQVAAARDVTIVVSKGGVIAGRVVTSAGEPVAEVQVTALPDFWSGSTRQDMALRGMAAQTTDGGGNFAFQGLAKGAYRLRASRGGSSYEAFFRPGTKAKTGDRDVSIVLDPPGGIRGQVQFSDGSAPKVFTVMVGLSPGTPVSDPQGKFELSSLPAGKHNVTIHGPGFADHTVPNVDIQANQVADLGTITVKRGRSVSGRVVDPSGEPVAGAAVVCGRTLIGDGKNLSANLGLRNSMMGIRRDTTDADGAYRIDGIPAGSLVIAAEDSKIGRSLPVTIPAGRQSPTINLRLAGYGSIDGKVTVNGGKPTDTVRIMAAPKAAPKQIVMVTASSDGSFAIERVAAGDYHVNAMLGGGMGGTMHGKDVTVAAGAPAQVTIDIDAGDVTVSTTVKGTGGAKVDAAQVFLMHGVVHATSGHQMQKLVMNGGGAMSFSFAGRPAKFQHVSAGRYSVCAIAIAGNVTDPSFWKKVQDHADTLAVSCSPHTVNASPAEQSLTITARPNQIGAAPTPDKPSPS